MPDVLYLMGLMLVVAGLVILCDSRVRPRRDWSKWA
jgi:hypothetical protein